MTNKTVIGIGEILWDLLPDGKQLGGAPANFAWHAQQLGANGTVVSSVGNDEPGKEIRSIIKAKKLGNGISVSSKPTGTVSVKLKDGIPDYIIHENVAWDFIELNTVAKAALKKADAICFGSLAQRSEVSRRVIHQALDITPEDCVKVFDINLRQHFYSKAIIEASLKHADVFKINNDELVVLRKMFELSGDDETVSTTLLNRFNLQMIALTRGDKDSWLLTAHEISRMETPKVKVADTIGAGDSFTAAIAMGKLHQLPLTDIHKKAVDLSAFVCTKSGAMPHLPEGSVTELKY